MKIVANIIFAIIVIFRNVSLTLFCIYLPTCLHTMWKHRSTWVENLGKGVPQVFAKISGGSSLSGQSCKGGPPILGFIAFLLISFFFNLPGGLMLYHPPPPPCASMNVDVEEIIWKPKLLTCSYHAIRINLIVLLHLLIQSFLIFFGDHENTLKKTSELILV